MELLEKAAQIAPDNQLVLTGVVEVHAAAGRRREALEIVRRLQTGEFASRISLVDYALIYNYLGETDKVFEYLERAFHERDTGVLLLRAYPELKNLRSDWRFVSLLRRIGLEK
jgi:predicted Zn-dependent protease